MLSRTYKELTPPLLISHLPQPLDRPSPATVK